MLKCVINIIIISAIFSFSVNSEAAEDWHEYYHRVQSENREDSDRRKFELIDSLITRSVFVKGSAAYIFYFNAEDSAGGFSHISITIDGYSYEAVQTADSSGRKLLKRTTAEALKSGGQFHLPTAIIKIPLGSEKRSTVAKFL